MKSVLFLCTGNYYRSRFAEGLFNQRAAARGLDWKAVSRGLSVGTAGNVGPISSFAVAGLRALGIRPNGQTRFPLQVTERDLGRAARVIALKELEHRPMVARLFPAWVERIEYWHVDDLDCALPVDALARLRDQIERLVEELAVLEAPTEGDSGATQRQAGDG